MQTGEVAMIAGIGTDIVSVARIRKVMAKRPESFMEQVFSPAEREEGLRRKNSGEYFAGRWAIKEAMAKALGCGIGVNCNWRDVSTVNNLSGRPLTSLSGEAAATAAALKISRLHVSLSHEREFASAMVVLECDEPAEDGAPGLICS